HYDVVLSLPPSRVFMLTVVPHRTFPLFPYTTLFRSPWCRAGRCPPGRPRRGQVLSSGARFPRRGGGHATPAAPSGPAGRLTPPRSEEHTSELQSRENLVCRLLLEKKKR